MPVSSLSNDQARCQAVAEHVTNTWRVSWENRTRLDLRNSSSWRPLHSHADCMIASFLGTQGPSIATKLVKPQEERQPFAQEQVGTVGGVHQPEFDGELPSVGSEGHSDGSCKRCAFFPKGRCLNGKDCSHCHFAHEPRSKNRKRRAIKVQSCRDTQGDGLENRDAEERSTELLQNAAQEPESGDVFQLVSAGLMTIHESEAEDVDHEVDVDRGVPLTTKTLLDHTLEGSAKVSTIGASGLAQGKHSSPDCVGNDAGDSDSTSVSSLCDTEDVATASSNDSEHESASVHALASACCPSDIPDSDISPLVDSSAATVQDHPQHTGHVQKGTTNRPLASTPTSWAAMRRSRQEGSAGDRVAVDITRLTRALLNKLTEERFDSLCSQIVALPFSTPEQLAIVVKEIFHKATTQNCFRSLYTELCLRLDAHLSAHTGAIGGKAFRRALVNECQTTFERNLNPSDASLSVSLSADERFETAMKLKTAILGNLRFIGDLLVRNLLSSKLLPPIVHTLLNGGEAELESLIALLEVVAPEFESKRSSCQAPLHDAFVVLRRRIVQKSTCQRVRCQIQNLFDARARGWAPRSAGH